MRAMCFPSPDPLAFADGMVQLIKKKGPARPSIALVQDNLQSLGLHKPDEPS